MHHCLGTTDVLYMIFKAVRQWEEEERDDDDDDCRLGNGIYSKSTLASLARTCRTFSKPALDVLWMKLYTLDPLILLFPRDPHDVAQWSKFHEYAKRINSLHGPSGPRPSSRALNSPRKNFVESVAHLPSSSIPLLPNLVEVVWDETYRTKTDPNITILKYLAGPAIKSVSLELDLRKGPGVPESAFLRNLPELYPNLTSFTAFSGVPEGLSHRSGYPDIISQVIRGWEKLRVLRTFALPDSAMRQLASQQSIETLAIDLFHWSPSFVGNLPDTVQAFTLHSLSPLYCKSYLQTVHAGPRRFCISTFPSETTCNPDLQDTDEEDIYETDEADFQERDEADIQDIFEILPLRLDTYRLQSFTFELHPYAREPEEPFRLGKHHLSVLATFSALHELDLDSLLASCLGDADYTLLAGSLPDLRILKVGTRTELDSTYKPSASVASVIALLRGCRFLHTLHMPFDGTVAPPPFIPNSDSLEGRAPVGAARESASEGWGVSNQHITKLNLGYSPIKEMNVGIMASCLGSLMPRLEEINSKYLIRIRWHKVQRLLAGTEKGSR